MKIKLDKLNNLKQLSKRTRTCEWRKLRSKKFYENLAMYTS